jgi:hypothetical protein
MNSTKSLLYTDNSSLLSADQPDSLVPGNYAVPVPASLSQPDENIDPHPDDKEMRQS